MRVGVWRDSYLGYLGPLSLLALIVFWAVLFVFGFALLLWGLALPLGAPEKTISFVTDLYLSGTTFFTLGLGDITPVPGVARSLVVIEVASGFGFLALVISYVPILYQAFSRRERRISLLDARGRFPGHPGGRFCVAITPARTSRNCACCCTIGKCGARTSWRVTCRILFWPTTARNTSNNPGWEP